MKQILNKKTPCELCNGEGFIDTVEINDEWNDEYYTMNDCPLCDGKGYLNIISIKSDVNK